MRDTATVDRRAAAFAALVPLLGEPFTTDRKGRLCRLRRSRLGFCCVYLSYDDYDWGTLLGAEEALSILGLRLPSASITQRRRLL